MQTPMSKIVGFKFISYSMQILHFQDNRKCNKDFYCKQTFRFYQNSQQEIITLLYTYRGFSQLDPERHQQVT